jgi:acetyl esterase/lipase
MVAVSADYRVKTRDGVKPVTCVADAKSCIRWVRENAARLGINPKQIVAAGGSAGGHLAASSAALPRFDEPNESKAVSSVPDALVLFNPVLTLAPIGSVSDEGLLGRVTEERLGVPPVELSPVHHVKPGLPPTIIFHGEIDQTVPLASVKIFEQKMREAGNRCELVGYAGQGHGFFNLNRSGGKYHRMTLEATDAFLVSLGFLAPPPGPSKTAQTEKGS